MKLRFQVDQAECFRNGIDCPKSIVTIEVDPDTLTPEQRTMIADRLEGIDVVPLFDCNGELIKIRKEDQTIAERIIAKAPTFEALMTAIVENHNEQQKSQNSHRCFSALSGWLSKSDASLLNAQRMLRDILASGQSTDDVTKQFFGTQLDGFEVEKFLAASTLQERMEFALAQLE